MEVRIDVKDKSNFVIAFFRGIKCKLSVFCTSERLLDEQFSF